MSHSALRILGLLALSPVLGLSACTVEDSSSEDWDEDIVADGKSDGFADLAQALELEKADTCPLPEAPCATTDGAVDEQSIRLYKLTLTAADQIETVMTVTSGDLEPHLTLFRGSTKVSSASFDPDGDVLTKTYEIETGGEYILAARAFRHRGAGSFDLSVQCTGGPCFGDFIEVPDLSLADAADCIEQARVCAFEDMKVFDGDVGPARSRQVFEGCLAKLGTDDGESCSSACVDPPFEEFSVPPSGLCAEIITVLPTWADQSDECTGIVNGCMEACMDLGADIGFGSLDDLLDSPVGMCWAFGFNSECQTYTLGLQQCGGDRVEDSNEDCHEWCEATDGVWNDDLDLICVETCDE